MSAAARKYLEKTLLEAVRKKCPHYTDSMVARVVEATMEQTPKDELIAWEEKKEERRKLKE